MKKQTSKERKKLHEIMNRQDFGYFVEDVVWEWHEKHCQELIRSFKKIVKKNKHCKTKGCQICIGVEETVAWILSDLEELKLK